MTERHLRAFVLMPFDDELDWAYDRLIRPAFEDAQYTVIRADDIDSQQNILRDVVTAIVESDVIVADLTGANPNVYYELGLAHALKKQVVLLSQDVTKAPFDLRSYRIVEYGARFDQFEGAQKRLKKLARDISTGEVPFGSPVSDFLSKDVKLPVVVGPDTTTIMRAGTAEEEDEPGVIDLIGDTEEGFAEQKELLLKVGEQIRLLGKHATDATPRIKSLTEKSDYRGLRSAFKAMSELYDARATDLRDINERLRLSWERTSDALEKRFNHSMTDDETREKLLRSTSEMCSTASEARAGIDDFTQKVDGLPNVEKRLTRSKRRLVRELRELVSYVEDVRSFEGRLTGILEHRD